MTKIDIFSGFLGAGKTTLIKKLLNEAYKGEKVVLIENEFGEIGIDGGFLQDAGIEITEMNSGCICCSLVGDFTEALGKVLREFAPDRVIIEPSGVGKLSDVIRAVKAVDFSDAELNCFTTVADVNKCKMYMKNFGEFFNDQIEHASAIVLSHTGGAKDAKVAEAVELLREHNPCATIVVTPWDELDGKDILGAMEQKDKLSDAIAHLEAENARVEREEHCHLHDEHEHHHHHHDDDEHECCCGHHHDDDDEHECCCGHHHDDDDEHECCHGHHHDDDDEHECCCGHHHDDDDEHECCHGHHHDDDDEHECCHGHHHDEHEHEHHHDHGEGCSCGCGGHGHHHHHADEVFTSFGTETTKKFTAEEIEHILGEFDENPEYGMILRAKGIVAGVDGWIHFDYVPGEADVRRGSAGIIGRLCVIGSGIDNEKLKELFGV